jgi:hypothetical protein
MSESDADLLRESLEAEQSMSFTQDLLKARLAYAETPSGECGESFGVSSQGNALQMRLDFTMRFC